MSEVDQYRLNVNRSFYTRIETRKIVDRVNSCLKVAANTRS